MSEIGNQKNGPDQPSSARSRFNFNNTRFTPSAPDPTPLHEHLRDSERRARPKQLHHNDKDGPLIFNVAQLLRDYEGATREYDYAQDHLHLNDALSEDIPATDATDIKGHVRFIKVLHDILAQGPGEAEVVLNCVRCLNDFTEHVNYELEEIFKPSIDVFSGLAITSDEGEDETELRIDANHLIDLGEAVRQQILVSLPMQPVCGDDCPGLYQYLDEANSDIEEAQSEAPEAPQPADPRWAALSKLKLSDE
jgi:uncharacterized protein